MLPHPLAALSALLRTWDGWTEAASGRGRASVPARRLVLVEWATGLLLTATLLPGPLREPPARALVDAVSLAVAAALVTFSILTARTLLRTASHPGAGSEPPGMRHDAAMRLALGWVAVVAVCAAAPPSLPWFWTAVCVVGAARALARAPQVVGVLRQG